jgi:eukaryotic-like serine/threonine-protein kinase
MAETPDGGLIAGRYRLREILGAGGMGTVWQATDELLGRDVAVKRVRLGDLSPAEAATARERTMREARIAAALHHPHVVSIFDVVVEDGEPWLVLEFLPSRSLGDVIEERHALPPADVAAIGAQVAAALTAAHAAGIVHRDVKPDNILIARPPATLPGTTAPLVKLTDFGIAHAVDAPAITATHVLTGTPAYFAPETAGGEGTDSRSDMYSLGATLYAAVEGQPPFGHGQDSLFGLLARIARGGAPPPRRAGPLTDLLRRLTADDPATRPTSAEAHHELDRLAREASRPIPTLPDPAALTLPVSGVQAPRRRRGPLAAAIALLAAAILAGGTTLVLTTAQRGAEAGVAAPTPPPVTESAELTRISITDPQSADPCSVLDRTALEWFGTVTVDLHNSRFATCRADIARADGSSLAFGVSLQTELEATATARGDQERTGQLVIERYPAGSDSCDRRVTLPDRNSILLYALRFEPVAVDLCAIAERAALAAVEVMGRTGIRTRTPVAAATQLGGVDACALLSPQSLSSVPGISPARPEFGGWGCRWSTYTDPVTEVSLSYYRGYPLDDSDGTPALFAGRPGRVLPVPGVSCRAQFVQREYIGVGNPRIESVHLNVAGPGTDTELCRTATALADAAAARLPPPS